MPNLDKYDLDILYRAVEVLEEENSIVAYSYLDTEGGTPVYFNDLKAKLELLLGKEL
jgi:hypothetical protein